MLTGVQHLSFRVLNGVKQGGIISPMMFNMYMDQLSIRLNGSGIGGDIRGHLINHLCYADDLCLITKNCDIDSKRQMRKFYTNIIIYLGSLLSVHQM